MSKRLLKIILWCASVLLVAALLFVLPARHHRSRGRKTLAIAPTSSIVTQIRSMSQLVTACFYDEVVLTSSKKREVNAFGAPIPYGDDEICIIADGTARAGIDLSSITRDSFSVSGDTLMMKLPDAEIFDVIVNPSGFEIFVEEGKWSHEEVVALESRAVKRVKTDALASGLIEKAASSARRQLEELFRSMGYEEIVFVQGKIPFPKESPGK